MSSYGAMRPAPPPAVHPTEPGAEAEEREEEPRRGPLTTSCYPEGLLLASGLPAPGKMSAKAKKVLDEARGHGNPELELADKGLANLEELPGLREFFYLFF